MGFRDYVAPGVTVIVERQQGEETVSLSQFYPVYIGTGMTSRSRVLAYTGMTANVTAFPNITFTVDFGGVINSQLYADTDFALTSLTIHKIIGSGSGPTTPLVKNTDYQEVAMISRVRADGQASFTVKVLSTEILATDLVYDFVLTAQNTNDDFDLRLVFSEDVYYAKEIFGPYTLTESGTTFFNDVAIAAEIAFRAKVPAFYYLEVPRNYGVVATKADFITALEKIYYKRNAYRIAPLTDAVEVSNALKSLVTSISNPVDKRETVGFVTYPVANITDMKDIFGLKEKVGGFSKSLNSPRISNVFGCESVEMTLDGATVALAPYFLTAGVLSVDASGGIADPQSLRELSIFTRINGPRFRPAQWNLLAEDRVWIVTQNDPADPIINRHQLTTSQSDAAEDQEYSLVKNIDAVTKLLRERLYPYAGKYNITDGYMEKLDATLTSAIQEAKDLGLARNITVTSPWAVRRIPNDNGDQTEKRNLVTRLKLDPAYPANNLDIYLLI